MNKIIILVLLLISSPAFAGVDFDSTDDLLTCGTSDILTENGAMTISAWIYPRSTGGGGFGRIIEKANGTSSPGLLFFLTGTMALDLNVRGTTVLQLISVSNSIVANTWQHVLITWTGSTTATNAHIYVNGTEVSYATTSNGVGIADNSAQSIEIGNTDGGSRAFDGIIDEVAVWSSVLGASDIENLAKSRMKRLPLQTSPSTLKAYWPLSNTGDGVSADGFTFNDLSGNGNNCTGDNGANNTGLTGVAEQVLTYL